MRTVKTLLQVLLGIVILIIGLIFCLANMTPVTLKFYQYESIAMPLWFLVIISILAGAVFTISLILLDLYRSSRKLTRLRKEIKTLGRELDSIKRENQSLENEKTKLREEITESKKIISAPEPTDSNPETKNNDEEETGSHAST